MKTTKTPLFQSQEKKLTHKEVHELKAVIKKIVTDPKLGEERNDIRENLRIYIYRDEAGKKFVSYYVTPDKIVFVFFSRLSLNV